ncbi:MAG: MATE family efflux transporter [Alphaproteobacteria bacterium]|nr:MAG: MATE family efflux transporter [Alphaproteobacteria bacterium]
MQPAAAGGAPARPFEIDLRMIAAIAVPMTLAYMTTPILGLVDTAVVGRLGDPALIGGLAVGAVLVNLIFTTFNFQRSGTTGLTAQALGAGDETEKQAILMRALILAGAAGVIMVLLSPLILAIGLWFMTPGRAVAEATGQYFTIRMLSAPFALANYAVLGWLIGLGRTGLGLALQFLLNGTNIVLSVVLGLWLGYGIAGVAWATVAAEVLAAGAGLVLCRALIIHRALPSRAQVMAMAAWRRLVNLNGDIMVRSFALLFAFAFFTAQGARYGEVTLAANAVLMHFFIIGGYFLDGLATAAEQIIGRALGARYRAGFVRGFRLTLTLNVGLAMALTAVYLVAGPWLIAVITTLESVRAEAGAYLWLAALTPLTGVLAFQMDGVYIGATWSREMSRMMLVSIAIYLITWWLMRDSLANTGLWLALHAFLVSRGVTLSLMLRPRLRTAFPPPA